MPSACLAMCPSLCLQTIPTMGAILLDPSMEKCLLVRGWSKAAGWGFPKGKISKEEADGACAAREVGSSARGMHWWLLRADSEARLPAAALRLHTSCLHMLPPPATVHLPRAHSARPKSGGCPEMCCGLAAREQALHWQSCDQCLPPVRCLRRLGMM